MDELEAGREKYADQHRAALVLELAQDPEGLGYKTAGTPEAAYALLHESRQTVTETVTGRSLSAGGVLKVLGLTRGRAFLRAVADAMPGMSLTYFGAGTALSMADLQAFRVALTGQPGIETADIDAVEQSAPATVSRSVQEKSARIGRAFVGIPYFPNAVDPALFGELWRSLYA